MAKLEVEGKFLDLSDYGRPIATFFVKKIVKSQITPTHITLLFGVSGLIAIFLIWVGQYKWAGVFLILKSIIDAADGELARLKKTPSYVGRYLDSIFDIVLNFILFCSIAVIANSGFYQVFSAFFCVQLQGTLYNYYYVILRNKSAGGDATSQIFENNAPKAFDGESQKAVNILFGIYLFLYGIFDKIIYSLDKNAAKSGNLPHWFMTLVSIYGLGFQLLLIAIMLSFNLLHYIIPFFIYYTIFLFLFIFTRKFLKE